MILKHDQYPEVLVYTSAGKAKFHDFLFETKDKKLADALRKRADVTEVRKPKAQAPAPAQPEDTEE